MSEVMLAEKPNPSLTAVKTAAAYFLLTLHVHLGLAGTPALQCSYSGTLAVSLTNWNNAVTVAGGRGRLVMHWFLKLLLPKWCAFH